jgi:hypothetical protein
VAVAVMMVAVRHRAGHSTSQVREPTSPFMRLAAVGAAVLGLLAVVALASRGGIGGGGRGAAPSTTLLDYGFSLFLILYVLSIPFVIWAYLIQQREARGGRGGKGSGLLLNLVVFVALVGLAVLFFGLRQSHMRSVTQKIEPVLPGRPRHRPVAGTAREPRFQWPVLFAVAGLGAAGAAAYVVHRRRRGPLGERRTLAEELSFALDDALDDVRAESDPRRAVIKAYARMEQILGAHGLARRPEETPYEYLARTLQTVSASAASAARLTDLYERARFSQHEIDPTMRERAIDALTAVRDELREAAA